MTNLVSRISNIEKSFDAILGDFKKAHKLVVDAAGITAEEMRKEIMKMSRGRKNSQ